MEKAQSLLDAIPELINKKKISGKDLPTEVFIKKKRKCIFLSRGGRSLQLINGVDDSSGLLQGKADSMDGEREEFHSSREN